MSEKALSFVIERQNTFHHPQIGDRVVLPNPYLTLPFRRSDLVDAARSGTDSNFNEDRLYEITEGWMYSMAERAIHGYRFHAGVDYYVPYGTPVVAPYDGIAMSSYQSFPLMKDCKSVRYEKRPITFGLGYFVQIYNPDTDRYIQTGHLSDVDESVPFTMPTLHNGVWAPHNHDIKAQDMQNHPMFSLVKRGETIGRVGFSGLRWGYEEYKESAERPIPLDTTHFKSYDEPHVHFEEFSREWSDEKKVSVKGWQRDPYGVYRTGRFYPTHSNRRPIGKEPLFYVDQSERPYFPVSNPNENVIP